MHRTWCRRNSAASPHVTSRHLSCRLSPGGPFWSHEIGIPIETLKKHTGKWTIEEEAIVGAQDPPGSGLGAYLVSEEKFGDFELMIDIKSDWKTDSGFRDESFQLALSSSYSHYRSSRHAAHGPRSTTKTRKGVVSG